MKIAHFSPLLPQQSGIAHYCTDLLPHLADHADVDIYSTAVSSPTSQFPFLVRPISNFLQSLPAIRYQYDMCLYHMGNHPDYHEAIYTTLMRCPGIVVLHETNLHAFYLQRSNVNRAAYIREMGYTGGADGVNVARQYLLGKQASAVDAHPLFQRIVHSSLGLIVHTEFARRTLLSAVPSACVVTIPLAVRLPNKASPPVQTKQLFQLPSEAILIGSFGHVSASKRIEVVLHTLSQLRGTVPEFHYLIIGKPLPNNDLTPLINKLALNDIVHQIGYTSQVDFESYLNRVDIGINLRTGPSGGEMSATLVHLLAHGKPTLVSNVGGFAALPNECVLKIKQDADEAAHLAATLRRLITNPDERARYGQAAQTYVRQNYSFPQVAQQYAAFAEEISHASP